MIWMLMFHSDVKWPELVHPVVHAISYESGIYDHQDYELPDISGMILQVATHQNDGDVYIYTHYSVE